MGTLADDLERASRELRETHISWVFLHDDLVFKVKKPVDFGFLDFSSLTARRRACDAEVRLNRRLARDVYRGVVPVTRVDGVHAVQWPAAEGGPDAVDWAVCMRRLPDDECGTAQLERGELGSRHLQALARRLASFHADSPRRPEIDRNGGVEAVRRNVLENFEQAHDLLRPIVDEAGQREVEEYQLSFLSEHAALFEERIRRGRIVDGHGDLRLEHVYFDDRLEPTVVDCIEFNDRFRHGDVCADVAFLSMDLCWHRRTDLAERLIAEYALESNDYDLYSLVDFYQSYRAYVRAKVAALSLASRHLPHDVREHVQAEARSHFLLAQASERPRLDGARLLAVGGLIASGKSTLSQCLAESIGAVRVSSDRTRKWLAGAPPEQSLPAASYTEAASRDVYAELMRRAAVVLDAGRSVILDASFHARAYRSAALELARERGIPFHFVECSAPHDVLRERLSARDHAATESDARLDLLGEFAARYQSPDELPESQRLRVETTGDGHEAARRVVAELARLEA